MKKNKKELKTFFETGDIPTEEQFSDLIDSYIDAQQPKGVANRRFIIDENGEVTLTADNTDIEYDIVIENNKLSLLKNNTVVKEIDLTSYIDDTNLARLVSGSLDNSTGIVTFKRDDDSTFTIDFSSLTTQTPYSFNNGIEEITPNVYGLGGSFTKSTNIKLNGFDLRMTGGGSSYNFSHAFANLKSAGIFIMNAGTNLLLGAEETMRIGGESVALEVTGKTSAPGYVWTAIDANNNGEWKKIVQPSLFAVVKFGTISHTPEIGSVTNYYNSIDAVLSEIKQNYTGIDFKIYIVSNGEFNIETTGTFHNVTIISDFSPTITTLKNTTSTSALPRLIFQNGGIDAPNATLVTNYIQTLEFKGNTVLKIKTLLRDQTTYQSGFIGRRPLFFSDTSDGRAYKMLIEIEEFYAVYSSLANGDYFGYNVNTLFSNQNYKEITVNIGTLYAGVSSNLAAGLQVFDGTLNGEVFNLNINNINILQEEVRSTRLNIMGVYMGASNATYNINVKSITGSVNDWRLVNQPVSGTWNIKVNENELQNFGGGLKVIDVASGAKNLYVNLDIKGTQAASITTPVVITSPSTDVIDYDTILIKLKANGTFSRLAQTYNYATAVTLDNPPLLVIDGGNVSIHNYHTLVSTNDVYDISKEFLRYTNNPIIAFLNPQDYVLQYESLTDQSTLNQPQGMVRVYGSIIHNASNINFPISENYRISKPFNNLMVLEGDD